jgi:acetyl esterase/lipase
MTTRRPISALLISVAVATGVLGGVPAQAAPASRISFAEPREFATGAVPVANAFNRATGDQLAFQISRAYVADGIAAGNFDEEVDGYADVVQSNVLSGTLSVFRGDGHGSFSRPSLIAVGTNPSFVVANDLDRDGHLDLVVADPGANALVILHGDGYANFTTSQVIPALAPRNVAIGDFNADDVADLAVTSRESMAPAGGVTILTGTPRNTGAVAFRPAQFVLATKGGQPVGANVVAVGDFDGSGYDDLAIGVGTSPSSGDRPAGSTEPTGDDLLVLLNRNLRTGDSFDPLGAQRFRVGATPNDIAVGDWNGDAHPDLAVLSPQSGDVVTLLGNAFGHFTPKDVNTTVGALPRSLKVGDFNADGVADLATAAFAAGTVSILSGYGDGRFAPAAEFWAGNAPTAVEVGLFDSDNRPDIVAARMQTDQMALLINGSPRRDDGVEVVRDISYVDQSEDPYAAHHTLDVFVPPRETASFAGADRPYPVFVFAHGGASLTGDKSMLSYLMRSLARVGIVAVTIDYRLTSASDIDSQAGDYADAFGWLRANVSRFGGDADSIVIGGTSAGSAAASRFATTDAAERPHIRAIVHVGTAPTAASDAAAALNLPATLAVDGDRGALEISCAANGVALTTVATAQRRDATFVHVTDRDHLTLVANLARENDPGRVELLRFLERVIR